MFRDNKEVDIDPAAHTQKQTHAKFGHEGIELIKLLELLKWLRSGPENRRGTRMGLELKLQLLKFCSFLFNILFLVRERDDLILSTCFYYGPEWIFNITGFSFNLASNIR